jgi:hypothetical protein
LLLWDCGALGDADAWAALAPRAGGDGAAPLVSLTLNNCGALDDACVLASVAQLTALTHLELRRCPRLSDAGLSALALALPSLRRVVLSRCDGVTARGVLAFRHGGAHFREVLVQACRRVGPDAAPALARTLGERWAACAVYPVFAYGMVGETAYTCG